MSHREQLIIRLFVTKVPNWSWSLPDGLPGLLFKATMDGLSDGRLHQIDVPHHQRDKHILQVFVEWPVAQVSCGEEGGWGAAGDSETNYLNCNRILTWAHFLAFTVTWFRQNNFSSFWSNRSNLVWCFKFGTLWNYWGNFELV